MSEYIDGLLFTDRRLVWTMFKSQRPENGPHASFAVRYCSRVPRSLASEWSRGFARKGSYTDYLPGKDVQRMTRLHLVAVPL